MSYLVNLLFGNDSRVRIYYLGRLHSTRPWTLFSTGMGLERPSLSVDEYRRILTTNIETYKYAEGDAKGNINYIKFFHKLTDLTKLIDEKCFDSASTVKNDYMLTKIPIMYNNRHFGYYGVLDKKFYLTTFSKYDESNKECSYDDIIQAIESYILSETDLLNEDRKILRG